MFENLPLRAQLSATIDDEMVARTREHQGRIAALKAARGSATRTALLRPLALLAHGDSWFDYPLSGNDYLPLKRTDVIAQLQTMGALPPLILNTAHHGDASTTALSLPKQQRLITALQAPENWLGGGPDAILFSSGGDDIAGDQFCIFLDYAGGGSGTGLNEVRFQSVLAMIESSYRDLFAFRDRYAPGVPVLAHDYDFPIPNGVHPAFLGPWLKPSLDFCGYGLAQGTAMLRECLLRFKRMLEALAAEAGNNFSLIDTQGTLAPSDWANELHPHPAGFLALAARFVAALAVRFPDRIGA